MRKLELYGLTAITFITLTAPALAQGDAAKGKAAFAKCGMCHQVVIVSDLQEQIFGA